MKVVISKKAYCQIRESVANSNNDYEVGGLLLGYKVFNYYLIVAATAPERFAEKSKVSFTLDGNWHSARALELIYGFRCKPSIIGIWHSHVCDVGVFSKQDRQSNKQFAALFNGALSIIVMPITPLNNLRVVAYIVSPDGKEKPCQIVVNK